MQGVNGGTNRANRSVNIEIDVGLLFVAGVTRLDVWRLSTVVIDAGHSAHWLVVLIDRHEEKRFQSEVLRLAQVI